ncbi:MAG: hypothetical protein JST12_05600 [Armatimonadetes bacterium]|nr:hypothetical protein [Armatimonadota bacterium]
MTSPKVPIAWAALTRDVQGPSYAKSATITFTPTGGTPTTWTVDRPAGLTAQTVFYQSPGSVQSGHGTLSVTFFSAASGAGTNVASASASIEVLSNGTVLNPDGTAFGTVTYNSTLTSLVVTAPDLAANTFETVTVSGRSGADVVALPQDLVDITLPGNPPFATLAGKTLTGVAEGTIGVQATFEAVTGSTSVHVTPPAATFTKYTFLANHIAYDAGNNKFWGTFGASTAYPDSIVDIDPATGTIGTPIAVGSNPGAIAVSADGTVAYVCINGSSTLRVVDLTSRTAGATIDFSSLYPSGIASDIKFAPNSTTDIAVCLSDASGQHAMGPIFYRSGVIVNQTAPSLDTAATVVWTSSQTVDGIQNGGNNTIYRVLMDTNDAVVLGSVDAPNAHSGNIGLAGNNVYFQNGDVFSSGFLTSQGQLTNGSEAYESIATDSNGNSAWLTVAGSYPRIIRGFDLSSMGPIQAVTLPLDSASSEGVIQTTRFGATGFAVLTAKGLYVLPHAPSL